MSRKLKTLNIVTALSIGLYYAAAFFMCDFSFNDSNCTDVGIIIAPLLIPSLILIPLTIIIDIVVLGRKLAPAHKRVISAVIIAVIVAGTALAYVTFERLQYYAPDKALSLIRSCKVSSVSYDNGDNVYLYPINSINGRTQLKVHGSEHTRLLQAIKDSAAECKYNIQPHDGGFEANY